MPQKTNTNIQNPYGQGGMGGNTELLNEVSNMTTNMTQTVNSGVKEHKITGELTMC